MLTISKKRKKKKMFTARSWQDQLGKQQFNEDKFIYLFLFVVVVVVEKLRR